MASISLGRIEAALDLERTFMVGTIKMFETGVSIELLAPVIGGDPRDIVADLVTSVDEAETGGLERLRAAGDVAGADEFSRLLTPRRRLLADGETGLVTSADATAVYDELVAFLDDRRSRRTADLQSAASVGGLDARLLEMLNISGALDTWSGSVAKQAGRLSALMGTSGELEVRARSQAGAAVIAGDVALDELQQTDYVVGTGLERGSDTVARWVTARDALLDATGMGNSSALETDLIHQLELLGAFSDAAGEMLGAAVPVYAAIDDDTLAAADGFVNATTRSLYLAAAVALLVISLALLWIAVLSRRITKPLTVLGRRAREVSNGQLTDDRIGPVGPREVAVLAVAFDEVCDNLRLVEHKAEALAAGRLEDEILGERVPGLLGQSLQQSITRVSDLTERLADQARRDPMTGLPNRTAVLEHLSDALSRRERSGDLLAVLFVDLDGFKVINDAFGHVTGDDVLREMGQRFRAVARAGEMVARLGGDEFVAIVECTGDPTRALTLGRRLIEAAERPVVVDDTEVTLSASVGVAVSSADSTPMGLLGEADQAVYEAKREGKARVRLYDTDLQAVMANRAALERELRRAIIADEFDIYLQPVVDADGGRLRSAEALVRWNRPGHGVVLPAEFIPFAEGSWLVVEIGRIVLDKACRALAGWVAEGHNHTVSVNIAGRHLVEADLVGDVRAALARHGAPPELFVVELTESQLVTDLDKAAAVLGELRALGVHVSLDDFGTGHSSLTYLRQLPIDTIKIDGSYINELGTTPDAHALIASLIHLADSLHLDVIAEGVETVEQADQLRAIGCPKLQGFLIARPLPLEQFAIPSLTAN